MNWVLYVALVLAGVVVPGARAQKNPARPPAGPVPGARPTPQERNMLGLPAGWIERLQGLSPEEQERFLGNNRRFHQLPPERQAQIRKRLQVWNSLTPDERQAMLDRERVWQQMTPEQRTYVRDTLLPAWQAMVPARRQLLLRKLRDLRGLDESQRASKLIDEAFLNGLNPSERNMLRDLSNLRVAAPEPPTEP